MCGQVDKLWSVTDCINFRRGSFMWSPPSWPATRSSLSLAAFYQCKRLLFYTFPLIVCHHNTTDRKTRWNGRLRIVLLRTDEGDTPSVRERAWSLSLCSGWRKVLIDEEDVDQETLTSTFRFCWWASRQYPMGTFWSTSLFYFIRSHFVGRCSLFFVRSKT